MITVVTMLIAAAASAPSTNTFQCLGKFADGSVRSFRFSFSQHGSSVANLAFTGDGPQVSGKWHGRIRDTQIVARISDRITKATLTLRTAVLNGQQALSWSISSGAGHVWFVDDGDAACSPVSGNSDSKASAS
jgi:hypothetical protein